MRSVLSDSSSARPRAVRIAVSEFSAAGSAAPVASAASSSHGVSMPAATSVGASRHGSGTSRRSSQSSSSSSRSAASSWSTGSRVGASSTHSLLKSAEAGGVLALHPALDEGAQGGLDGVEGVGQLLGAAARRGRRVVQLVRQPRRHLAQRRHLLALRALGADALVHRREHPEQPLLDLLVGVHHLAQRLARHQPDPARHRRAGAAGGAVAGQHGDRSDEAAGLVGHLRHQLALERGEALHPALEQDEQRVGPVALLEQPLARLVVALAAGRRQALERLVGQPAEEVDRAQVLGGHVSAR